jgi:hypothetical protein
MSIIKVSHLAYCRLQVPDLDRYQHPWGVGRHLLGAQLKKVHP